MERGALYSVKRAVYSVKRAVYSVKRALYRDLSTYSPKEPSLPSVNTMERGEHVERSLYRALLTEYTALLTEYSALVKTQWRVCREISGQGSFDGI